jgi:hypothetical protein
VHPAIAAPVLLGKQNLDPVGPKLVGDRLDVVYEEARNRTGCEMAIHVAVWSEDLNFAAVGQLQHAESRTVQFGSKAHEVSKEVSGLLEVRCARPHPSKLDDLHTVLVRHPGRRVNRGPRQSLPPAFVLIKWPAAPSVVAPTPKAIANLTAALVRTLPEAQSKLAAIEPPGCRTTAVSAAPL